MDSDKKRYSRGIDNVEHGENEKLITCRICYDGNVYILYLYYVVYTCING